ncbi:MAG: hypothetical protein L0I24_11930 [Pseudonocardia sp.]|nr:hypothetical protein [Pseudonocardia sp.]
MRARRRELHDQRALLRGSARTALRDALAAARTATLADATADLADLRHQIDGHAAAAVGAATRAVEAAAHARWAERAVAAERRTAADRGVVVPVPPDDPGPEPPADPPAPHRTGPGAALADAGTWRLAVLPLVVAPLSGFAGPAVLLPALGAAALVLGAVVRSRRAAIDRAHLRRWSTELLAATHARIDTELARRTVVRAAEAGARLDAALAACRAAVDAEIALLTPEACDAP